MSSALVEQPVSDLSADISDIINELDGTAVDDLDLTSFLNEDSTSLSDYYQRDLLALAAPSNDPFSVSITDAFYCIWVKLTEICSLSPTKRNTF